MSRRVAAVAVLALALVVGIMLGPVVFGLAGGNGATPSATATSAAPTTTEPTIEPPTSEEASTSDEPPTSATPTLTPEQRADRDAGVVGDEVAVTGSGDIEVVPGSSEAPDGDAPVMTVRVEVEPDLEIDGERFADFVMTALNDPRGWGADGSVRFERTDGEADIRVVLATPTTVDSMCAPLATNGRWSCGRYGHAALNAERWVHGADAFLDAGGTMTEYREYLVNHEVGHLLGHPHESCPGEGEVAPVMVQQSISVQGCLPNGWPFP
jgi:hypothetical protein